MKYASEILDLLESQPDQQWRMRHLVEHVTAGAEITKKEFNSTRTAILRLMNALEESGQVEKRRVSYNSILYIFKPDQ